MSKDVSYKIAINAADNGILLGQTTPSEESKYSYWKLFDLEGMLIACAYDGRELTYAEEITPTEIPLYVDNEEEAQNKYKELTK